MLSQQTKYDLPVELILKIFLSLSLKDIATAALVCKLFNHLVNNPALWKEKFKPFKPNLYSIFYQHNIINYNYKDEYHKEIIAYKYKKLYGVITQEKISYWKTIFNMNNNQLTAIEELLTYIEQQYLNKKSIEKKPRVCDSDIFDSLYHLKKQYPFNVQQWLEAAYILKAIIFGQKDESHIQNFLDKAKNSSNLTKLYNKFINVGLISNNTLSCKI